MNNVIITIAREYGSGGRQIGQELAHALNIPFYDKEIIEKAAEDCGVTSEFAKRSDEKPTSSLLYNVATHCGGHYIAPSAPITLPISDRLAIAQHHIIRGLAQKGSCVIIGRCADHALKADTKCVNIFIHAPLNLRITRAINEYGVDQNKVHSYISKTDKTRAVYYSHYTGQKWGNPQNYHLCIDSSIGITACVELIKNYLEITKA